MEESLKEKTVGGVLWSAVERFSVQGIQFLVLIVIARMLSPKDYGLIGMLTIFLAVADSLCNSGFSQALIRKQDRTEKDNSTVFYFNLVISLFLYGILYLIAPWVAAFYQESELCLVMRVVCITVIFNSLAVVQRANFIAKIDFKSQAKASLSAAVVSGATGIYLAYSGFGVWTLVYQQLMNAGLLTALLWAFSKWRPRLIFSWISFCELFRFGSKLLISGLLDTIWKNLYQLIIGKMFSASSLGFYSRAHQFADFPSSSITNILQRVTYPVLCRMQNEDERLAINYRKILRVAAYIIFPMMVGLASIAEPFVDIVLGEKWHETAILLIPICLSMMWYPIHAINLSLLQVKGRSDLFLRLEIIKKIMGVIVLIVSIPFGVIGICFGAFLSSLISLTINTYYTGKLIKVGFFMQLRDLSPILAACGSMALIIWMVTSLIHHSMFALAVGTCLGIVYYLCVTYFFKFSELKEVLSLVNLQKVHHE